MIIIIMMTIITIICYANSKHVKPYKFWICGICDPWYYKEELLILDVKCWNTFRCSGSWWYH